TNTTIGTGLSGLPSSSGSVQGGNNRYETRSKPSAVLTMNGCIFDNGSPSSFGVLVKRSVRVLLLRSYKKYVIGLSESMSRTINFVLSSDWLTTTQSPSATWLMNSISAVTDGSIAVHFVRVQFAAYANGTCVFGAYKTPLKSTRSSCAICSFAPVVRFS